MAKLFYTLEEAADKLGRSTAEIQQLIESGQLQEFRDRDQIMLKVDQVNLLTSAAEESSLSLAEDAEDVIALASDSGSAFALDSPQEQSGVSIFDADELEEADPSAQTQISDTGATDFALDPSSSGSGLLDLTREVDDTSLGADLLEDVYAGDTLGEESVTAPEGSELFESTGAQTDVGAGGQTAAITMVAEYVDPGWSGFATGAFLGAGAAIILAMTVVIGALTGGFSQLVQMIGDQPMIWMGAPAGAALVFGLLGAIIGKKSR